MEPRFRTPHELVEGLHQRDATARAQLWALLREPVERLMDDIITRFALDEDSKWLTVHALHATETSLRSQPPATFASSTWNAFRAAMLSQVARLAVQPHGTVPTDGRHDLAPLPEVPAYRSETFSRPYSRIGGHCFGGDWYTARQLDDGSLWVFLADVTGHGYFAYLLASALPAVWQRCWNAHPGTPPQPAELLAGMHHLLSDSLPDGIFLEATLARLGPDGRVTVAPAGGTRLLYRCSEGRPDVIRLRGAWLGIRAPTAAEQHEMTLEDGDELILTTDGVFDQLDEEGGLEAVARAWAGRGSVFVLLRELLERSLASVPQKDDLTVVWVERRDPERRARVLRFPSPLNGGPADV